jgi:TBCC domain-containing protein 1
MGSGTTHQTDRPTAFDKKKITTSASAKELPVWLVGTFLLLHCEEMAYLRNLSGHDERRFYGNGGSEPVFANNNPGKVDFNSLLKHPSLSPRYDGRYFLLLLASHSMELSLASLSPFHC